MGNCACKIRELEDKQKEDKYLNLSDFKLLYPIGRGGFGRVWKVRLKRQYNNSILSDIRINKNKSRIFAMKEMNKAKIYYKKSVKSVANERKFLEIFNYPLLCNMHYAFQDTDNLYIIMDYLSGGDLRYQICKRSFYTEEETKFIAACITLSLEYIHKKNVIHRDIKPENLVFDNNGYLHLTDFGIAMEYKEGEEIINASGTPGYMAPEVIVNKNHDFGVDYFALGVIVYELMMGERPYNGKTRKEIKEQMMAKEVKINTEYLPDDWEDSNIIDFINKLLKRKKSKRLGANGIFEIKNHPWFKNMSWGKIVNGSFSSPFVFDTEDNFDNNYANKEEDESIYEGKKDKYILEVNKSKIFQNFYYNIEDNIRESSKTKTTTKNTEGKVYKNSMTSRNNIILINKDENIIIHNINKNMKLSLDCPEICPIDKKILTQRKSINPSLSKNFHNILLNRVDEIINENKDNQSCNNHNNDNEGQLLKMVQNE